MPDILPTNSLSFTLQEQLDALADNLGDDLSAAPALLQTTNRQQQFSGTASLGEVLSAIAQAQPTTAAESGRRSDSGMRSATNPNTFSISYRNAAGNPATFKFSLLPAIEHSFTYRSGAGGGMAVPEVKPGILQRTDMQFKTFQVPGGTPAIQSLGTAQSILQLVGAFIGEERDQGESPGNALRAAQRFDNEIVQLGREVGLLIEAYPDYQANRSEALQIIKRVVIQSFRYFATRHDKVYYAIEALVSQYPTRQVPLQVQQQTVTTPVVQAGLSGTGSVGTGDAATADLQLSAGTAASQLLIEKFKQTVNVELNGSLDPDRSREGLVIPRNVLLP